MLDLNVFMISNDNWMCCIVSFLNQVMTSSRDSLSSKNVRFLGYNSSPTFLFLFGSNWVTLYGKRLSYFNWESFNDFKRVDRCNSDYRYFNIQTSHALCSVPVNGADKCLKPSFSYKAIAGCMFDSVSK